MCLCLLFAVRLRFLLPTMAGGSAGEPSVILLINHVLLREKSLHWAPSRHLFKSPTPRLGDHQLSAFPNLLPSYGNLLRPLPKVPFASNFLQTAFSHSIHSIKISPAELYLYFNQLSQPSNQCNYPHITMSHQQQLSSLFSLLPIINFPERFASLNKSLISGILGRVGKILEKGMSEEFNLDFSSKLYHAVFSSEE